VKTQVPEGKENEDSKDPKTVGNSTKVYQQEKVEGSRKSIEESLAKVGFETLTKANRPCWREFCGKREKDCGRIEADIEREMNLCNCYAFNQHCWADSEERWLTHIRHCVK
jgi:hypothetical protein